MSVGNPGKVMLALVLLVWVYRWMLPKIVTLHLCYEMDVMDVFMKSPLVFMHVSFRTVLLPPAHQTYSILDLLSKSEYIYI
jgi:hypothetical protein